ncbi:hypothetical protein HHK36_026806 [Tetracentron sinense]|uniref:Uncharacterized protein n=1 Tax=Tetracentron sinense TaxID=13715 RepID=A0A834YKB5_TETSI|nr:hypothetical protein HHK36_026806 [Tetracentron sinense]
MGGVGKTTLLKKINNEFLSRETHDFDVVIWVVVSKESNVRRIQKGIGERLGLPLPEDESQDAARAARICSVLRKKKFLLLLDDIWDRVNLELVGIPHPDSENKCKVVFTTRSEAVCGRMEAQKKIRVECLRWNEAWDLFRNKVGEETLNSYPKIPELAKVITRECAGLPLALITIGQTMASKKTPNEWNHAITVLRKSASEFKGMGDEVFPLLKYSYDSLPNDSIRSCFLYCAMFPEDNNIDKEDLIQHWIWEGFIDGFDVMNEAVNQGYHIIGILKLACLLESGSINENTEVKMHDVIRDLALWISRDCGKKQGKLLVQADVGLTEAPEIEKWEETEKISLMYNRIGALTETPTCPNLLTLLLNNNYSLRRISDGFFKFMPTLRILDLSGTNISYLPMGIFELVELQCLNLSNTPIRTLPDELKMLVKLKYLDLSGTKDLETIPIKVIFWLPRLQVLNLFYSYGDWEVDGDGGASFGEAECLKHLKDAEITITTVPFLQKFFNFHNLTRCTSILDISGCKDLTALPPPPSSATTLTNMKYLKKLILKSLGLEELTFSWLVVREGGNRIPSNLETLILRSLFKLKIIKEVTHPFFQNLVLIRITECNALKDLTWLLGVRSLQTLHLFDCIGIEEVICGGVATVEEESSTFSMLKVVFLSRLPKLKSIYQNALPFPSLQEMRIGRCPMLKKLPFDSNSAKNTLKSIEGEKIWWDQLEWDDEPLKSAFLPHFIQIGRSR